MNTETFIAIKETLRNADITIAKSNLEKAEEQLESCTCNPKDGFLPLLEACHERDVAKERCARACARVF